MYQPEHRGARQRTCHKCGQPVLHQRVGNLASLDATTDTKPIPPEEIMRLVEPNRLAWCLAVLAGGGVELRWRCRSVCGHGLVIEHRCAAEVAQWGRRPEGTLW